MQHEINEYQHNFNMNRKEELITFLQSLDENHQFFLFKYEDSISWT